MSQILVALLGIRISIIRFRWIVICRYFDCEIEVVIQLIKLFWRGRIACQYERSCDFRVSLAVAKGVVKDNIVRIVIAYARVLFMRNGS